jgi:hypothetical protein
MARATDTARERVIMGEKITTVGLGGMTAAMEKVLTVEIVKKNYPEGAAGSVKKAPWTTAHKKQKAEMQ